VDFHRISLKQEIQVKVPIRPFGEAPGVKLHGGIMEHILREVEVKCLPTAIPESIPVDLSSLDMGHALHVQDLSVPPGVSVLTPGDQVILTVVAPKEEVVAAEVAPGAVVSAEPEVIGKGKKEEVAEGAAPSAPVEKAKEPPKK